jgi:hypothetical protein
MKQPISSVVAILATPLIEQPTFIQPPILIKLPILFTAAVVAALEVVVIHPV